MPATTADTGYGARFGIKDGSTYDYVAEVTSVTPPGWTRDTVEATNLESPNQAKEFIKGLIDGSEASIEINYAPAVSDDLHAAFIAGSDDFRILFPSGTVALDFFGIVTGFTPGDVTPDGKMTATFTVKPSGLPVFTSVTP